MPPQPMIQQLQRQAAAIRKSIVQMVTPVRASHVGGALSCVDILAALYFSVLRIDPKKPYALSRDRFVFSKGHGGTALYATLAHRGFFPLPRLKRYCRDGSPLLGHATRSKDVPGLEVTAGSLGHGFPMANGMAYAAKLDTQAYRVFVLLSDGECDEGTTWESALFAGHHRLDNLTVVIDYNKIQSYGRVEEVLGLEPFAAKWRSFGCSVKEVNGHDFSELLKVFGRLPMKIGKPSVVICHTVKGKGVSFMENKLEWHYRSPTEEQYAQAMKELDAQII